MPFVDIANRFTAIGVSLSLDQIAADLSSPSSPVARAIDGAVNYLIAALCEVTGRHAAPICSTSVATQVQARIAS